MHRTANYAAVERSALALAVITFLLMFVGLPRLRADDRAKCQRRIEKAEARLDGAIRAHGPRSPEADARRQDLRKERESGATTIIISGGTARDSAGTLTAIGIKTITTTIIPEFTGPEGGALR